MCILSFSLLADPHYLLFQMVGRGKAPATRARARTRASATPESSKEHTSQYVFDLLARMQAMDERFAAGPIPTPQPQPVEQPTVVQPVVQPVVAAVVQPGGQPAVVPQLQLAAPEQWLRLIERFQKMRAPEFQGSSDPQATVRWREDISSVLSFMGVDFFHKQRLAAYTLKGDAGMWYRSRFTEEERLTTDWDYFVYCFEQQFVSSAARAGKERELMSLEQGDVSVDVYESRFTSLSHFTGNLF